MAMAAMTVTVFTGMTVPRGLSIGNRRRRAAIPIPIEGKEHGQSYFLDDLPDDLQKLELDAVRNRTPWVMLAGFVTAFLAIVVSRGGPPEDESAGVKVSGWGPRCRGPQSFFN